MNYLQMLMRRSLSLLCRTSSQVTCRPYLTDGTIVIGSDPDRLVTICYCFFNDNLMGGICIFEGEDIKFVGSVL